MPPCVCVCVSMRTRPAKEFSQTPRGCAGMLERQRVRGQGEKERTEDGILMVGGGGQRTTKRRPNDGGDKMSNVYLRHKSPTFISLVDSKCLFLSTLTHWIN